MYLQFATLIGRIPTARRTHKQNNCYLHKLEGGVELSMASSSDSSFIYDTDYGHPMKA